MKQKIKRFQKRAGELVPGDIIVDDDGRIVRVTRVTNAVEVQVTDGKKFLIRTDDGVLTLDLSHAQEGADIVRIDGADLPVQYFVTDDGDDLFVPKNDHAEEKAITKSMKKIFGIEDDDDDDDDYKRTIRIDVKPKD